MSVRSLSLPEIRDLALRALCGAGASPPAAAALATAVAAAERDGIRSHGLLYLPTYCEHLRCGKVAGTAEPLLTRTRPGAQQVEARNGFAHPAIELGFTALVPAARELGCAALAVRESYNCGVLGYHTEQLAAAGLLGIGFTNAPAAIAPPGGTKAVIGTNPFSLAVPDGQGGTVFLLDQSASVVAKSEILLRAREGEPIPEGWALDADGRPTTDPEAALKGGSMLPAGGHKGFGTGLLVEVMAAAMSGAFLGLDASPFSGTAGGPPRTGQFFLALDPAAYGDAFVERIARLCEAVASQPGARLPGDRRKANRAANADTRLEVPVALIEKIEVFCAP